MHCPPVATVRNIYALTRRSIAALRINSTTNRRNQIRNHALFMDAINHSFTTGNLHLLWHLLQLAHLNNMHVKCTGTRPQVDKGARIGFKTSCRRLYLNPFFLQSEPGRPLALCGITRRRSRAWFFTIPPTVRLPPTPIPLFRRFPGPGRSPYQFMVRQLLQQLPASISPTLQGLINASPGAPVPIARQTPRAIDNWLRTAPFSQAIYMQLYASYLP